MKFPFKIWSLDYEPYRGYAVINQFEINKTDGRGNYIIGEYSSLIPDHPFTNKDKNILVDKAVELLQSDIEDINSEINRLIKMKE